MSHALLSVSSIQNYLKHALKPYLNIEIRNNVGVVRNEANRLNYAIYYYISYLEDLILNNVDQNVIQNEECQLLTKAKEVNFEYEPRQINRKKRYSKITKTKQNNKHISDRKRRRPEPECDNQQDTTVSPKPQQQRKQYNLRSSLTNKIISEIDGVDDDDNIIIIDNDDDDDDEHEIEHDVTIEREREEIVNDNIFITNNLNENIDEIPLNQQQNEPLSPIIRNREDVSIIELDCTPLRISSPVISNIELNASSINEMLDLVNEVLLDQQQIAAKLPILTPASPPPFTSSSPIKSKQIDNHEVTSSFRQQNSFELTKRKEYERIYQELYSVCNRN